MKAHRDRKRCRMHLSDEVRFYLTDLSIPQKTVDVKFIFNIINNRVSIKVFGNFSGFVVVKGACAFHLTSPFSRTTTAWLLG